MRHFSFALVMLFFSFCFQGTVNAAPSGSVLEKVLSLNPEEASSAYFKKAHSALVYDPAKIIVENGVTRYEQADSALFFNGLWWAFLSGFFLMFTSLGLFVLMVVLGLIHWFRYKDVTQTFKIAAYFVATFVITHAVLQYFAFQLDQIFSIPWVHLLCAAVVIILVGMFSMTMLGLFYDHTHPLHFKVNPPATAEYYMFSVLGVISAGFMLSQKNSLLLSFARQSILSELSGSGFGLASCVALGAGVVLFAEWCVIGYFLKEESINVWFSDAVSMLAWLALYELVDVLKPFIILWHAPLITILLLLFAGVYFWSSARVEMTHHYFVEYSKKTIAGPFNQATAGFRFFNFRVLIKRILAVVSFILIIPFMGKLYLNYHRMSLRQAVFMAIKKTI